LSSRWQEIQARLDATHGDPGWWPADTPWEVAVGAVLTQNTAWRNVERALTNLRKAARTTPQAIAGAAPEVLAQEIRPSGYFRQKTQRLQRLARWWLDRFGDDVAPADPAATTHELRAALLALKGIGPETADSILLYAFGREIFVVDAYTARLCARLQLIAPPLGYDELQQEITSMLPQEVEVYQRVHAQIVLHCKDFCTKRKPKCNACSLQDVCPGPAQDPVG